MIGPTTAIWELLLPIALLGVANGFVWAPVATTATRNLPMANAGSGAGIYNTTRQVGAVLGSAAIAVLMESRLEANLPVVAGGGSPEVGVAALPPSLYEGFATAMGQAIMLPAAVLLIGLVAVLAFALPRHLAAGRAAREAEPATA